MSHFLDTEADGVRLTREEILDICFLFLIAGLDTVTATLDCMFAFLCEYPGHPQQLVDDPSTIPTAIEELLRWETSVMGIVRSAVMDSQIAGCPVQAGDQVIALLGSANTDEAEMDDADVVRFDRESNRHLAFGGGIHRCLGSHLAPDGVAVRPRGDRPAPDHDTGRTAASRPRPAGGSRRRGGLLRIAAQAPTASKSQSWRWTVVTDEETRAEIARICAEVGSEYLALAAETADDPPDPTDARERAGAHRCPRPGARPRHPVHGPRRRCQERHRCSGLPIDHTGGIELPARAPLPGLGSVWTTLHLFREREIAEMLGIPDDVTQVALLPVAHTVRTEFMPARRPPVQRHEVTFEVDAPPHRVWRYFT